ncbi:hypothetical protein CCACVL1_25219 [Corchorus capsularis]|uniref:Uncharacterized protein n=1 Tax=Corchorus capsularis TaxID=210143 RepID=A0A1R3GLL6_COCAP|nr:hypothetical protein CCACVL1_25219 [Corchorus capsularis]
MALECLTLRRCTLPPTFHICGRRGTTLGHLKSLVLDVHEGCKPPRKLVIKIHDLVNLKNFESRDVSVGINLDQLIITTNTL